MADLAIAIGLWLIAAVIGVVNGYFSYILVAPLLGEYGAHLYRTIVLIPVFFFLGWIYVRQTQVGRWGSSAWGTGFLWLGLSTILDIFINYTWLGIDRQTILLDYQIWMGRFWTLVLLAALVAPVLMSLRSQR